MENAASRLTGAWRLQSSSMTVQSTGERLDAWGADAKGTLILDTSGRMAALITRSGRISGKTDVEKATLFQTMLSYSGTYVLEDDRLITSVDLCWEPAWVGTEQTRYYTIEGDTLILATAPMQHPGAGGEMVVAHLEWRREYCA